MVEPSLNRVWQQPRRGVWSTGNDGTTTARARGRAQPSISPHGANGPTTRARASQRPTAPAHTSYHQPPPPNQHAMSCSPTPRGRAYPMPSAVQHQSLNAAVGGGGCSATLQQRAWWVLSGRQGHAAPAADASGWRNGRTVLPCELEACEGQVLRGVIDNIWGDMTIFDGAPIDALLQTYWALSTTSDHSRAPRPRDVGPMCDTTYSFVGTPNASVAPLSRARCHARRSAAAASVWATRRIGHPA